MKIRWKELTDREISLQYTPDHPGATWVEPILAKMDEAPFGKPTQGNAESRAQALGELRPQKAAPLKSRTRPLNLQFSLRKVDEVAIVDGEIRTEICLLCSRCGKAFAFPLKFPFSALFCKDPVMAGISHLAPPEDDPEAPVRPSGQNYGVARTGGGRRIRAEQTRERKRAAAEGRAPLIGAPPKSLSFSEDDDRDEPEVLGDPMDFSASSAELDITYLTDDSIDLGEVLSEQIRLQLPAQPLCQPNCKGVCFQCGADLSLGRCACAQIQSSHPFEALKDHPLAKLQSTGGDSELKDRNSKPHRSTPLDRTPAIPQKKPPQPSFRKKK